MEKEMFWRARREAESDFWENVFVGIWRNFEGKYRDGDFNFWMWEEENVKIESRISLLWMEVELHAQNLMNLQEYVITIFVVL